MTDTQNARTKRAALYAQAYTKLKTAKHLGPSTNALTAEKFNTPNKDRKTQVNHSSHDRSRPNLQAKIAKYRQKTNY